jgi:hypothetical protein
LLSFAAELQQQTNPGRGRNNTVALAWEGHPSSRQAALEARHRCRM